MFKSFTLFFSVTILFILSLSSLSPAQIASFDTVKIYDTQFVPDPGTDRTSPLLGDSVVVQGLVMNGPRELWIGARWGIFIVDPDSFPKPWSGFFILQSDTSEPNTNFGFLETGMICNFSGVVTEFEGFTELQIYGDGFFPDPLLPVEILSVGNPLPDPLILTAADLAERANAEPWESMWARIENATVVNNAVPTDWASITDASGATTFMGEYSLLFRNSLPLQGDGSYNWPAPGTLLDVNGFVREETQANSINPLVFEDVVTKSNPPLISLPLRSIGVPTSSDRVDVTATIVDNVEVATVTLHYSVDEGPFQQVSMFVTTGDEYSGRIPFQADGAFVRYFISAEDNDGDRSISPGDTSRANGRVFFYVVRDNGLSISDVQFTHGYALDNSGYEGYEVTLQGVVTTEPTDRVDSYWIQEAEAPWSGIRIRDANNDFAKGDLVEVTGTVEEDFEVTRINNVTNAIVVTPGMGGINPLVVNTGDVNTTASDPESYENVLVRIENLTVSDPFPDAPSNFGEFAVDDGSGEIRLDDFMDAFNGNNDSTFALGDPIEAIEGIGWFSFDNYKILPRNPADIIGHVTGIEEEIFIPEAFSLEQNYPNPFNPTTSIEYTIGDAGDYRLVIYNVLGQQVRVLANERHVAGRYEITWNGRDDSGKTVGSGIYFYRLAGQDVSLTRKMILLR